MRTAIAALALGISAVMVPSSAYAYTASFEVEDYTTDSTCVNHTFDVNFDAEGNTSAAPFTVGVTDPNGTVVHTLRTEVRPDETRRENVEMIFCRAELVSGTYTISGTFGEPIQARRQMNPETFEVTRVAVVAPTPPPPVTSSTQTGHVRVTKVARGVKVVFKAGTEDQRWKVRVKGTTRRVFVSAGEREVKVYNARSVRIKTLGARVY